MALCRHTGVEQAAVIARGGILEEKQLVAYIVGTIGTRIDSAELRRSLTAELPEYMIPAAIMVLPEFRLTASGKLNRAMLPPPTFSQPGGLAPRNREEELLASLFCEVLNLEQVAVDKSFFELGGHSLL